MRRPIRFLPTVSLGQILTVVTLVGGFTTLVMNYAETQATMRQDVAYAKTKVDKLETVTQQLATASTVQGSQLENLASAVEEQKVVVDKILDQVGKTRESIADIKARLPK